MSNRGKTHDFLRLFSKINLRAINLHYYFIRIARSLVFLVIPPDGGHVSAADRAHKEYPAATSLPSRCALNVALFTMQDVSIDVYEKLIATAHTQAHFFFSVLLEIERNVFLAVLTLRYDASYLIPPPRLCEYKAVGLSVNMITNSTLRTCRYGAIARHCPQAHFSPRAAAGATDFLISLGGFRVGN